MLTLVLLLAQIQAPAVVQLSEDREILSIVDVAKGLPPEFSADIYLKLAATSLIAAPAAKRQLIEDAFQSAAHAELPYRYRTPGNTDARPAQRYWENNLEALTLQTRAVEAMLAIDPPRALAMYSDISLRDRQPAVCEDGATPSSICIM